jgi:hypothetical protein
MQIDGVDETAMTEQLNKIKGIKETPPPDEKKEEKKPEEKKPEEKKPETPEDKSKSVSDPEAIKAGILNEMFGDQFKTVEDVKKANIPESLKELVTLRQKNQELDALVKAKPKHQFANDDIAKMNEFVRETGIKDVNVFNKLNSSDLSNMSDIDVLSLNHVIDNPRLAGESPQEIRGYFERKYKVDPAMIDPKRVEAGDLTQEEFETNKREYRYNQMDLQTEAEKVKTKLLGLKEKIKMPEPPADEPGSVKKWTPEVETLQKTAWAKVNEKMGETFSTIPIVLEEGKDPIVNFVLPEDAKKSILDDALDFVVNNQMEVNEANIKSVANAMYSDILFSNRHKIYHSIFERARSMTEEEYLKVYHNPSSKNTDAPPPGGETDKIEEQRNKAFQLETGGK